MADYAGEIVPVNLEDEMKQSYLDYAMSVIVGRALPDVRDGLKPVHRRVLYAMREMGNDWNKAYKKSARVVGDVIGKYHPHGDSAVYDAIVRLAQPFSMRYMLVDGQGNFGSVDGDAAAAMRYTEVRMARIAHELLADIEKETVDYLPNYDETEWEPSVLPTRIPNLLVNGSSGIAVGMATNIPPHNLGEVVDACLALIEDPYLGIEDLMAHLPGPDFPTAGIINGAAGIREAYLTGRGRVLMRARAEIEHDEARSGRASIVVTELPYQVNKARLLEKIADLVKEKRIEGITELRDESDKDGIRMVIDLRRGEVPEVVLNNLYQHTQMESSFGINMVALADGQPRLLNLKQVLEAFLDHRRAVVTRRTLFDLRKARDRAHVLEGLAVALANLDEVIALIRNSGSAAEAKQGLLARSWPPGTVTEMLERAGSVRTRPDDLAPGYGMLEGGYRLTDAQAQAILDLRLHRLTGLERDRILEEYQGLLDTIRELIEILASETRLMEVIRDELLAVREQYGDDRRTEICANHMGLTLEDLITEEDRVVTLSRAGYIKAQSLTSYAAQRRGGRGKAATALKEEDMVERLLVARTHDSLLCFSTRGKVYWLKVYELPVAGRNARGKPVVNLLPFEEGERLSALLPVPEFEAGKFLFMVTRSGTVKKTPLEDFSRRRSNGIIALDLRGDDELVDVALTDGNQDVMLFTSAGKAIRFKEAQVRPMSRLAGGMRGVRLGDDQRVIAMIVASEGTVLTATEHGYGKRTRLEEFNVQGRGGQGLIAIQTNGRNGELVGAALVDDDDEVMLLSSGGVLVRTRVEEVSVLGRNTQGVKLISLGEGERLVGLERVDPLEEELDAEADAEESSDTDAE